MNDILNLTMNDTLNLNHAGVPGFWDPSMGHTDLHIERAVLPMAWEASGYLPDLFVVEVEGVAERSCAEANTAPNIMAILGPLSL